MCANTPQIALPPAIEKLADRLTASYSDLLTATVVDGVVRDCYQPFKYVRIPGFVPIFVEHDSRGRLRKLTGHTVRPALFPLRETSGEGRFFTAALRRLRATLTRRSQGDRPAQGPLGQPQVTPPTSSPNSRPASRHGPGRGDG
jgi:hypothetical protein